MQPIRSLLPLAALFLVAAAPAPGDAPTADRLRGHVQFLASDALEGREAGTRGHEVAAAYVAAEFRKVGLQPAGTDKGWFQAVPLRRAIHDGTPGVTLVRDGKPVALVDGKDFGLRPSLTEKARSVDARLVFVGHGVRETRLGIDDYAGLDVRGAIVVMLSGVPKGVASDVAAHLASGKGELAASLGAVGMVLIPAEDERPGPMSALERNARPMLGWVDDKGKAGSSAAIGVNLALSDDQAASLFRGTPSTLKMIRKAAERGPVKGFALPLSLRVSSRSKWEDLESRNVVARLPGGDPALAGEAIVLMAHLDHIGIDEDAAEGEDRIRNGALDNAIGIATMLEAARRFRDADSAPRRSILFIATTAEEKGLLGADYFASNPTPDAGRVSGLVNLDMPLLLYDFSDVIAFGSEHSSIGRTVQAAAASLGVSVAADPMPDENLFTRSDHYSFVRKGVPSVFLMTGHANGGKAAWDRFLGGDYHGAGDDLAQPIDWLAGARFVELNYRIARTLANAAEPPRWTAGSFFAPPTGAPGP